MVKEILERSHNMRGWNLFWSSSEESEEEGSPVEIRNSAAGKGDVNEFLVQRVIGVIGKRNDLWAEVKDNFRHPTWQNNRQLTLTHKT